MKKVALFLTLIVALAACKSENKDAETGEENVDTEQVSEADDANRFRGEFIYIDDGAVLKGSNFIYGVALNEMAEELRKRVEPVKKDTYDMVPVIVKGTVAKKAVGAEGWDEIITITEIVNVSKTPAEADIKIEDKKK
ncbi:MAG: hypothetical protein R3359_08955 [Marinirhabdus sp.]|nr:hypothetical protein [Marinirhabdus sp.]